ncbi:MAG: D-2-hydroxyacid dehydrogenase [Ruminococcaceae bacterium]|nr:D-2-hydroxyacid dehydrogenase [Oscillospiraceae bacterium]
MRYIAVFAKFLTEAHRRALDETAGRCGFAADYYDAFQEVPPEKLDLYEVIYGKVSPRRLRLFPNLRWLCLDSAGADAYLQDAVYPDSSVVLSNSSGTYGVTVAEHMLMLTLMILRQMPVFQRSTAAHEWHAPLPVRTLSGSTVTVLGTGDIGAGYARRVKALGVSAVRGVRRSDRPGEDCFDAVYPFSRLEEALPGTDVLAMALPHTPETVGILSRERIALLPQRAVVVNAGRGSAVDQQALLEALHSGALAGAALDVTTPEPLPPDHPLWDAPNLILTPHVAGNLTAQVTRDLNAAQFCRELERYAAGDPLLHAVDRRRGY